MKMMFLDESGDHSLARIQNDYPLFVLGGIVVEEGYASGELDCRVKDFKKRLLGDENAILHTADITRSAGAFRRMRDPEFRGRFYRELNELIDSLDFQVIACVIKKDRHLEKYGLQALDPYVLSLGALVERFCFEIQGHDKGAIVAEKRDATLDNQIELQFLNLKISGTQHVPASEIARKITSLTLRHKSDNISALQVADLVVTPIGRDVLGKNQHPDIEIIDRKFIRSGRGEKLGIGLVIVPK